MVFIHLHCLCMWQWYTDFFSPFHSFIKFQISTVQIKAFYSVSSKYFSLPNIMIFRDKKPPDPLLKLLNICIIWVHWDGYIHDILYRDNIKNELSSDICKHSKSHLSTYIMSWRIAMVISVLRSIQNQAVPCLFSRHKFLFNTSPKERIKHGILQLHHKDSFKGWGHCRWLRQKARDACHRLFNL